MGSHTAQAESSSTLSKMKIFCGSLLLVVVALMLLPGDSTALPSEATNNNNNLRSSIEDNNNNNEVAAEARWGAGFDASKCRNIRSDCRRAGHLRYTCNKLLRKAGCVGV